MKSAALADCLFCVGSALAAGTNIYRDGWIDLDKNGRKDAYEDASRPVARRVDDLLKRMTLTGKISQLWQVNYDTTPDKTFAEKLKRGEISSFLDGSTLIETPVMRNKLQHIAVEQSQLGIPMILGHDVIHGFRTVFPIPLAEAARGSRICSSERKRLPRARRRRLALTGRSRRWWTWRATRAGGASPRASARTRGSARSTRRRACAGSRKQMPPTRTASSPD